MCSGAIYVYSEVEVAKTGRSSFVVKHCSESYVLRNVLKKRKTFSESFSLTFVSFNRNSKSQTK